MTKQETKNIQKCTICGQSTQELFYVYNSYCPDISYKCCRDCMENERLPYWGIVGLLALPSDWDVILSEEDKTKLWDITKNYFHKTHSDVEADINKAKNIVIEIKNGTRIKEE